MIITKIISVLFLVIGAAIPVAAHTMGRESDSGIKGPPYAELVTYFSSLVQKYPGFVQVSQYGKTPKGRPLVAIKISYPARFQSATRNAKAAILITGTTHGNEYLGIEDKLPEWFASEGVKDPIVGQYFKTGGSIYLVPIFNPDGYEARRRENSRGVDLNRDFTVKQANFVAFKEAETQAIRDMVASEVKNNQLQLLITMDYHCCIGAALYPWSFRGAPQLPATDLGLYKNFGKIIQGVFGANFQVGTTPDVLGYSAIGTSKDYYYENYRSMSFTYEGEESIEKNKFKQHVQMWRSLIQYGQLTRGLVR